MSTHEKPERDHIALVCEEMLSLAADPIARDTLHAQQAALEATNAEVLRAILTLDHALIEKGDEQDSLVEELHRVELKLDLVMALVVQLVLRDTAIPPPVPCRLSARGVKWRQASPLAVGEMLLITLFLSPKFPRPVRFPALVKSLTECPAEGFEIQAEFQSLPDTVTDSLERLVFLHHRRQVAQAHKR